MSKILIVEDQVLIANHIKNILNDNDYSNIELAYKLNDATLKLKAFQPKIILLDINVEGPDTGINWAKENLNNEAVIFITGQTELDTMKKALSIEPISYLTKPVKEIDLIAAINLAEEKTKKNYIVIKDGYDDVKLFFNDILFLKSDKNYIDIQLINKKISVRSSLDNIQKELDTNIFCRVHRSYIINKNKILLKSSNSIKIESFEIPISRTLDLNI